jgi:N-methylhydantoinase A
VTRVGADVGGTFTDVVVTGDDGRLTFTKVLSTPPAYDRAVVNAVQSLGGADEVVHGTTVATNAVLEQRGALTAVVTTEGFRDVLELRRMRMPHLYDYFWTKPPPLVERHLRFEVAERVLADGTVRTPLDETDARAVAARLREAGVESVAVCLLHAHLSPHTSNCSARFCARSCERFRSRCRPRSCANSRSTSVRRRRS